MHIAPQRLWGWEPSTITVYEYEDGVLVRSIATPEGEFTEEQVDLLLAGEAFRKDVGSHGHLLSESTSDAANPDMPATRTIGYVPHGPFFDWAKKVELDDIDRYKSQFPKDSPPNLNGAYWTVEKQTY